MDLLPALLRWWKSRMGISERSVVDFLPGKPSCKSNRQLWVSWGPSNIQLKGCVLPSVEQEQCHCLRVSYMPETGLSIRWLAESWKHHLLLFSPFHRRGAWTSKWYCDLLRVMYQGFKPSPGCVYTVALPVITPGDLFCLGLLSQEIVKYGDWEHPNSSDLLGLNPGPSASVGPATSPL